MIYYIGLIFFVTFILSVGMCAAITEVKEKYKIDMLDNYANMKYPKWEWYVFIGQRNGLKYVIIDIDMNGEIRREKIIFKQCRKENIDFIWKNYSEE